MTDAAAAPGLPLPGSMFSSRVPDGPISSLLLAAAGGALVGARPRRTASGAVAALAGLALVGVAAHPPIAAALRRAGAQRRSAHLRLSIVVPRPVNDVFRFCSDFTNFARFVGALRGVEDFGDGRSHWVAWTPTGGTVSWDAVTTKFVTNRVIAWHSTPGSPVRTHGILRFIPEPGEGTCVKIAIDYSVVDGSFVDAVAALASPRRTGGLESDIRRLVGSADVLIPSDP